jgi:carboxylate-amine ligase
VPEFRLGLEEEYFVTNPKTRNTLRRMPPRLLARCRELLPEKVSREFLQSQLEIATRICDTATDARAVLTQIRSHIGQAAAEHGLAIIAAGTHPMAEWTEQRQTDKPRYDQIMDDLGMIGRRNMVCGMHVHVDIPDPDRRVEVMNRLVPYLPILLALSTSSPFWTKRPTGLMGYRLAHYDELPRTGLPELFRDPGDYDRYIDTLAGSGVIPDASYVWWMVRPSVKYPTLELRVADCCTRIDDAISIAALYQCIVRALWRRPELGADFSPITRLIADENKWRAQRYGIDAGLIDEKQKRLVPFPEIIDNLLALIAEDADHLGCKADVEAARSILKNGTSAHRQRAIYSEARQRGAGRVAAVREVVDWLIGASQPPANEVSG